MTNRNRLDVTTDTLIDRQEYIRNYGYVKLCNKLVDEIAKYSPILEVCAGTGHVAEAVTRRHPEVDYVATDSGKWKLGVATRYFPVVKQGAAAAINAYPERNVFMSWPPYNEPVAANAVKNIKPGRYLLLVSEGRGGCVGSDELFDRLDAEFEPISCINIDQWDGLHDYLSIYKRL